MAVVLLALAGVVLPQGTASAYTTKFYTGAGPAKPTIGIITDSAGAGIRWYGAWAPLTEVNFVYDGESCRRTVTRSCRGRERYAPHTALATLRRLPGRWGDVLVMATGYNDPGKNFARDVDAIMAEAQRQGIPKVMWLTLRTAAVSYVAPTYMSNAYTFYDNNKILLQKAAAYGGRLQIADWATFTKSKKSWFSRDGVHYSRLGAYGAADYIAQQAQRVAAGASITPSSTGDPGLPMWQTQTPRDSGVLVEMIQNALHRLGIDVAVTGVYDAATTAAVRRFQTSQGLPVTGMVDTRTAQAMGLDVSTAGGGVTPPPPPPPASGGGTTTPGQYARYVIRRGDSLIAIARKTRTPFTTLLRINRLRATSLILPGRTLLVLRR